MSTAFASQFTLKQLDRTTWECTTHPQPMGNALPIAYGGFALALACKAAGQSVPAGYNLYSLVGNYLSPASTDRPLRARVRTVRQTRSFATRHVEVLQVRDDGRERVCVFASADFHAKEKGRNVLEYSRSPRKAYSHYSTCRSRKQSADKLLAEGKITHETRDKFMDAFAVNSALFDARLCPEGVFAQTLNGIAKALSHSQDHLPITECTTADWFCCTSRLPTQTDHVAALAFFSDGALSFCPLTFSHMYLEDAAACSSMDFALRFFREIDVEKWCLREVCTNVGAEGRTFSESWFWDEEGRAVASMSQQSILRAWPEKGKL